MKTDIIYLYISILMLVLINAHSIITKIKTIDDYKNIRNISVLANQIIIILLIYYLIGYLEKDYSNLTKIILIIVAFFSILTTILIFKDFTLGIVYN